MSVARSKPGPVQRGASSYLDVDPHEGTFPESATATERRWPRERCWRRSDSARLTRLGLRDAGRFRSPSSRRTVAACQPYFGLERWRTRRLPTTPSPSLLDVDVDQLAGTGALGASWQEAAERLVRRAEVSEHLGSPTAWPAAWPLGGAPALPMIATMPVSAFRVAGGSDGSPQHVQEERRDQQRSPRITTLRQEEGAAFRPPFSNIPVSANCLSSATSGLRGAGPQDVSRQLAAVVELGRDVGLDLATDAFRAENAVLLAFVGEFFVDLQREVGHRTGAVGDFRNRGDGFEAGAAIS